MNHETLRAKLHEAAGTIQASPVMPRRVVRGVRRRQTGLVAAGALSLVALVSFGAFVTARGTDDGVEEEPIQPAGVEKVLPMARGREGGIAWEMNLHRTGEGSDAHEGACVTAGGKKTCLELSGYSYGDASVDLGYVRALDKSIIVVKTAPGIDGPTIRESSGTAWAGLVAGPDGGSEAPTYWYRFLDGGDVEGVISVASEQLSFKVRARGVTVRTSLAAGSDEFPELARLPGDKQLVASGPDGGGYSVIVRRTTTELCLHINGASDCRAADAEIGPLGVAVARVLQCVPADECAPNSDIVILAGEVSPEVHRVGIRDEVGTSYVYLEGPFGGGCCFFSTFVYGRAGDQVELIAFNEAGDRLDVKEITY